MANTRRSKSSVPGAHLSEMPDAHDARPRRRFAARNVLTLVLALLFMVGSIPTSLASDFASFADAWEVAAAEEDGVDAAADTDILLEESQDYQEEEPEDNDPSRIIETHPGEVFHITGEDIPSDSIESDDTSQENDGALTSDETESAPSETPEEPQIVDVISEEEDGIRVRDDALDGKAVTTSLLYYLEVPQEEESGSLPVSIASFSSQLFRNEDGTLTACINPNPQMMPLELGQGHAVVLTNYASQYNCRDITDECAYDADTGFIMIPSAYENDVLSVLWSQPYDDVINLPVRFHFVNAETGEETIVQGEAPSNQSTLSASLPNGLVFTAAELVQNDCPVREFIMNAGTLLITTAVAGGDITIHYLCESVEEQNEQIEAQNEVSDELRQQEAAAEQKQKDLAHIDEVLTEETLARIEHEKKVGAIITDQFGNETDGDTGKPSVYLGSKATEADLQAFEEAAGAADDEDDTDTGIPGLSEDALKELLAPNAAMAPAAAPEIGADVSDDAAGTESGSASDAIADADADAESDADFSADAETPAAEEAVLTEEIPVYLNASPAGFRFNAMNYSVMPLSDDVGGGEMYDITNARIFNGQSDMAGHMEAFGYNEALYRVGSSEVLDGPHQEYARKYGFYVQILGCDNPNLVMNDVNRIGRPAKVNVPYQRQRGSADYEWITNAVAQHEEPNKSAHIESIWTVRGECSNDVRTNLAGTPQFDPSPDDAPMQPDGMGEVSASFKNKIWKVANDNGYDKWEGYIACFSDCADHHKQQTVHFYLWTHSGGSTGLRVRKVSAKPEYTTGNSYYPLKGAEFEIRRASDNFRFGLMVTDVNGYAEYEGLPAGTYKIQETKVPSGWYRNDGTIKTSWTVTLDDQGQLSGEGVVTEEDGTVIVHATNYPQTDPVAICLVKQDGMTQEPLPGSVWELQYFAGNYKDELLNSVTPTRRWQFITCVGNTEEHKDASIVEHYQIHPYSPDDPCQGKRGEILYDSHHLFKMFSDEDGGGELFENPITGKQELPLGSYRWIEVSPPPDLSSAGTPYTVINGAMDKWVELGAQDQRDYHKDSTYVTAKVNEAVDAGAFSFWKLDTNAGVEYIHQGEFADGTKMTDEYGHALKQDGTQRESLAWNYPQGAAVLGPATYTLTLIAGGPIKYQGRTIQNNMVVRTITTDQYGHWASDSFEFPFGRYRLTETNAPEGYLKQGTPTLDSSGTPGIEFTIESSERYTFITQDKTISNEVARGGFQLQKRDIYSGLQKNGNADFGGTGFTIFNMNIEDVYLKNGDSDEYTCVQGFRTLAETRNKQATSRKELVTPEQLQKQYLEKGIFYDDNGQIMAGAGLVTNWLWSDKTSGLFVSPNRWLPVGKYRILEIFPQEGYTNNWQYIDFEITRDGEMVKLDGDQALYDYPTLGGVKVYKRDKDLGDEGMREEHLAADWAFGTQQKLHACPVGTPSGAATLKDIAFDIINRSNNAVMVNGVRYPVGQVCLTIYTDENGIAQSQRDILPPGTYEIVESVANTRNTSYAVDTSWSRTFSIQVDTAGEPAGRAEKDNDGKDYGIWHTFCWEEFDNDTPDEGLPMSHHRFVHPYDFYEGTGAENQVITGQLKINKFDLDVKTTTTSQGDATLEGAVFEIINNTGMAMYIEGKGRVENGGVVAELTTNNKGQAESEKILPVGAYIVRETKPPVGYELDGTIEREFNVTARNPVVVMQSYSTGIVNIVKRGSLEVRKADTQKVDVGHDDHKPQGTATFEGTKFNIINRSTKSVWIYTNDNRKTGKFYQPGEVVETIYADASGVARSKNNWLPYGTYGVVEVEPPARYRQGALVENKPVEKKVVVHESNRVSIVDDPFVNEPWRGDVTVAKHDADGGAAQGDATLEGTEFKIANNSPNCVVVEDPETQQMVVVEPGDDLPITLVTNKQGVASTRDFGENYLPIGAYLVRETKAPHGYKDGDPAFRVGFEITEDGQHVRKISYDDGFRNEIISGGVKVAKRDILEIMGSDPEGNATFEGTILEIVNRSTEGNSIKRGKNYIGVGDVVMQVTLNEFGEYETGNHELPYGTYGLREYQAPDGYKKNEEEYEFMITNDGEIKRLDIEHPIRDESYRITIEVQKRDSETGDQLHGDAVLAGAEIEIRNISQHAVAVPDSGGNYKRVEPGDTVITLVTNDAGIAITPPEYLPVGRYEVVETRPPHIGSTNCYLNTPGGRFIVDTKDFEYKTEPDVKLTQVGNCFVNDIVKGGLAVAKRDADTYNTLANGAAEGNATLAGAVFRVINRSAEPVRVNGKLWEQGETVLELVSDATGEAATGPDVLPFGTYGVVEKIPPEGYLLDETEVTVKIREPGRIVRMSAAQPILDKVKRFDLDIAKLDFNTDSTPEGNATLANAVFNVISLNDQSVIVDGNRVIPKNGVVTTITTNEKGIASTGRSRMLPIGKYRIEEHRAPDGYQSVGVLTREIEVTNEAWESMPIDDKTVRLTDQDSAIRNIVKSGSVKIAKRDATKTDNSSSGNAELSGAVFTVYNQSPNPVYVERDGKWVLVPKGQPVGTIISGAGGIAEGPANWLPYGTYSIRETQAPDGYLLSTEERTFTIETHGLVVDLTSNENAIHDIPVRGGIEVEKWDIEWQRPEAMGDATVQGAVFEIVNRSEHSVIVDGVEFAKNAVIKFGAGDLVTNERGYATTGRSVLPYGSYELREKVPPTGYLGGAPSIFFTINQDAQFHSFNVHGKNFENQVIRGTVEMTKRDAETGDIAQGDARFGGAQYEIVNKSRHAVRAGQDDYRPEDVVYTLVTDDTGYASVKVDGNTYENEFILPYGTYELHEVVPPEGYCKTDIPRTFKIERDRQVVSFTNELTAKDEVIRAGVRVRKIDRVTGESPQGRATLEDAQFQIISRSQRPVRVLGRDYNYGDVVYTMHTNSLGLAETTDDLLPYGTYGIVEVTPPEGYLDDAAHEERVFNVRLDGHIYDLTGDLYVFKNSVIRGGVGIRKVDSEQPSVGIGGALMEIRNLSPNAVVVNDETIAPGDVVLSGVTDDDGYFGTLPKALPYGDYEIREAAPPEGYTMRGITTKTFSIRTEGQWCNFTGPNDCMTNEPIRGDVKGIKVTEENGVPIANVPFRISNDRTGEYVDVVTNEEGKFSTESSWNPHARNTNRGQSSKDGVWMGPIAALNEDKGALRYGHYTVDELPCENNKGRDLKHGLTFHIATPGQVYDFGTITNTMTNMPNVSTNASDTATRVRSSYVSQTAEILDVVWYSHLEPGAKYTLKTWAVDKDTEQTVCDPVITNITPVSPEGTETVTLRINTVGHNAIVVYEELFDINGSKVASHTSINDDQQTVTMYKPTVSTSASFVDGSKVSTVKDIVTIYDNVSYTGLIPGQTHTVRGRLVYKGTADPVLYNGAPVTASATFTPTASSGKVRMSFTVDGIALSGRAVTVLEVIDYKNTVIASHEDPNDEEQTVMFGSSTIGTTLSTRDGQKTAPIRPAAQLVDNVECRGLSVGSQYKLEGRLMYKASGQPVIVNNVPVTGTVLFTATSENIPVQVPFTVDTTQLQDLELVCFERLTLDGKLVATHEDINDINQTIGVPTLRISTQALAENGGKLIQPGLHVRLNDTVAYNGLVPGMTYTMHGTLMVEPNYLPTLRTMENIDPRDAGVAANSQTHLDEVLEQSEGRNVSTQADSYDGGLVPLRKADGTAYEIYQQFVPVNSSGSETLTFDVDSRLLAGLKIVVYEELLLSGTVIADHKDPNDDGQTVRVDTPGIHTKAEGRDGSKYITPSEGSVLIDTVSCTGLVAGETYTLYGTVMDKSTREPVYKNGLPVTVRAEFTAKAAEDEARVTFTVDTSALVGHELVVYEKLYLDDLLISTHEDINDAAQTVTVRRPEIGTYAHSVYDGQPKDIPANGDQVIIDEVTYNGLEPGQVYTLKAMLWNKTQNTFLLKNGQPLTVTQTFTPKQSSGVEKVSFTIDARTLEGTTLVAYEELIAGTTVIADHKDPNDADQTVQVGPPDVITTPTGDNTTSNAMALIVLCAGAAGAVLLTLLLRRRRLAAGR